MSRESLARRRRADAVASYDLIEEAKAVVAHEGEVRRRALARGDACAVAGAVERELVAGARVRLLRSRRPKGVIR